MVNKTGLERNNVSVNSDRLTFGNYSICYFGSGQWVWNNWSSSGEWRLVNGIRRAKLRTHLVDDALLIQIVSNKLNVIHI